MSQSKSVRSLAVTVLLVALLALTAQAAFAAPRDVAAYSVTLENLTGSQPFSPPVIVSHGPGYNLFRLGTFASDDLRLIAEGGNNGPAAATARASASTFDVVALSALIMPGQSTTAQITGPAGARLSLANMLGITNDGFTGVTAVRLPLAGSVSFDLLAYDAGTEANNELAEYVPGYFGGMLRAPTRFPIASHPGILGVGDMDPAVFGWHNPVGRLTITRID